jgi:hypothetical protein
MSTDTNFDHHGFYADPPRHESPLHYLCFMIGVELGLRGKDRNPEIGPDANDPEGCERAYHHGHAWGLKLRADFGPVG